MTAIVDGIVRFQKLMSQHPDKDDVKVTVAQFDDIVKTINYHMSNYSGYDLVIDERNRIIAYVRGRSNDADIYLTKEFLNEINF
jgi:hypothetical protein